VRVGGVLSDLFGANGRRILDGLSHHVLHRLDDLCDALGANLSAHAVFVLRDQLAAFDQAAERIATYDAFLGDRLAPYREPIDRLCTVPGVDQNAARAILIELGPDIGVFPSVQHCAAWAGLCPGNHQSAGKRRPGRTRKGNAFLRRLLVECAHGAARTHGCQFHGYHKALTVRRGYKRATVATAHKMLRCIYAMLANATVYHDPKADYEALMVKRNAPRWIAMLKKYGLHPVAA